MSADALGVVVALSFFYAGIASSVTAIDVAIFEGKNRALWISTALGTLWPLTVVLVGFSVAWMETKGFREASWRAARGLFHRPRPEIELEPDGYRTTKEKGS